METIEAIHTRRSVREYKDQPIPETMITQLLAAAMAAPSARNQQPWEFVVITDKDILEKIAGINPYAQMTIQAPLAVLVCGNLESETAPGYWVVDCAAAAQNMLLCAHALGLGGVWTGTYPNEERMDGYTTLFGLPEHVIPHTLLVFGYPIQQPPHQDRFNPDRIHHNGW